MKNHLFMYLGLFNPWDGKRINSWPPQAESGQLLIDRWVEGSIAKNDALHVLLACVVRKEYNASSQYECLWSVQIVFFQAVEGTSWRTGGSLSHKSNKSALLMLAAISLF
jgi:hypothetical protein